MSYEDEIDRTEHTLNRIRPWEVEPGDRILGTDLVVSGFCYRRGPEIGSEVERQRYVVQTTDGREVPYVGDSWVTVIREAVAQ